MNKKYNVLGMIALAAMLPAALYAASRYNTTLLFFVHMETAVCLCVFAACSIWFCLSEKTLLPFLAIAASGIAVSVFYINYACLFLPPLLILCSVKTAFSDKTEDKVCFYISLIGEAVCAVSAIVRTIKEGPNDFFVREEEAHIRIPALALLYASALFLLFLFHRSFSAVRPQKHVAKGKANRAGSKDSGDKLHTAYLIAAAAALASAVCGTVRANAYIVPASAIAWVSLFVSLALCGDPVMTYLRQRVGRK